MRKRIGIYGASDEALALIPLLSANPAVEIAAIVDPDALGLLGRLPHLPPVVAALLEQALTNDPQVLAGDPSLQAVIDAGADRPFAERFPAAIERGLQVVSPLTARLLWGLGVPSHDRQADLLQALHEVVDSYNLTIDADELFVRMLEIAIGVTGAEGGSLMLVDEAAASWPCASRSASSASCGRRSACRSATGSPAASPPRAARCACAARPTASGSGSCASGSTSSPRCRCRCCTTAACSGC